MYILYAYSGIPAPLHCHESVDNYEHSGRKMFHGCEMWANIINLWTDWK